MVSGSSRRGIADTLSLGWRIDESRLRPLVQRRRRDWKQLPMASRHFDLEKDVAPAVIQEAMTFLASTDKN